MPFENPPLKIQEEDGSPAGFPHTLKVTNGDLTDNGDGTFSLDTAGGGGGSDHGGLTGLSDDDHSQYALLAGRAGDRLILADDATTPPLRITERSSAPSAPGTHDLYLDDGTNTGSGSPGFRRYTGAAWEDVGAVSGGGGSSEWTDAGSYLHPTDNSGNENVMIGTNSSPSGLFEVRGTNGSPTQGALLIDNSGMDVTIGQLSATVGKTTTFTVQDRSGNRVFLIDASSDITLGRNTELFIDNSTSSVGIGTSTPAGILEVLGTNGSPTQGALLIDNSGMDVTIGQVSATPGKTTTFQVMDRSGDVVIEMTSGGDVQLGS